MVMVDPDPLVIPDDPRDPAKTCHAGAKVQAFIYKYMALPIIKIRWVILGKDILFNIYLWKYGDSSVWYQNH